MYYSQLLGMKCVLKHPDLQIFGLKIIVGRGNEAQLQVGGHINKIT